jgi:hypothetical protein
VLLLCCQLEKSEKIEIKVLVKRQDFQYYESCFEVVFWLVMCTRVWEKGMMRKKF